LVTVRNSTMGVIFRDDTRLSLGPNTELNIDEFIFDPLHDDMSFLAQMRTGSATFLTGKMAQIAPDKMQVSTPLTTIGIRGTKFLISVEPEVK
ncbi:MAG: FecR domain-containing protein, partial [Proteobacteria bacterium]|nr:FecR domain-containing protein [Pseudomonadota bacterium]